MKLGNINFIGASSVNNGVTAHIANKEHIHPGNTITIAYNGSVGEAFYQSEEYWASDDVNVLYPKFKMTPQIALFFLPILKQLGKQYAFENKWKLEDMKKETIPLPCLSDLPNWQYMNNYICNLLFRQKMNYKSICQL